MRNNGFQLWSANLLLAFIKVHQAQIFGCACSKRKCPSAFPNSRGAIFACNVGHLKQGKQRGKAREKTHSNWDLQHCRCVKGLYSIMEVYLCSYKASIKRENNAKIFTDQQLNAEILTIRNNTVTSVSTDFTNRKLWF